MAEMMKVLVAEDNKELCAQAAAALRCADMDMRPSPHRGTVQRWWK